VGNSDHQESAAEFLKSARPESELQRAIALHQRGQLSQAEALYRQILAGPRDHFDALHMLGVIEAQRGNLESAVALLDRALRLRSDCAEVYSNLGVALAGLGRHEVALANYDCALGLKPSYAEALNNRGMALWNLNRYEEALASYERALEARRAYVEALNNRGMALWSLERYDEALVSFDRALEVRPEYADAHNNRGAVLRKLRRVEEALTSCDRALALRPNFAEAYNTRGAVLSDLRRYEEALACYQRALHLAPDSAEAHNNLGNALVVLRRTEEAIPSYERALALRPGYVQALSNLGNAFGDLRRYEDAAAVFAQLLEVRPDHEYVPGRMFHAMLRCCDWSGFSENRCRIVESVSEGRKVDLPLTFLAVTDSSELQLQCSRTYVSDRYPPSLAPLCTGQRYRHDRIRLAYVSADFRDHAVSCLMAGLFEAHDRGLFETIALSLRPDESSEMGRRVRGAFGRFIDASRMTDRDAALLLRDLEVDIAVDLTGFTADARTGIFAHRPAPVQVNYLGFPATMGAGYFDYIIADRFVIPVDRAVNYSEKVVYLPDTFQANDDKRRITDRIPTREEEGLPPSGFVFCSFNNSYKIQPDFFGIWMRLLRQVPGSVLWLVGDSSSLRDNLRMEAARQGVEPGRLLFAPRVRYADHLARLRLADLFLDSLPYNAGTTASDALWAGLPVLTCAGDAFAARMAGSLLHAIGLPHLVTFSVRDYEALALRLATSPPLLGELRATLARNRLSHPLFNTDRFRRHIEAAYLAMWERYENGQEPGIIAVADVPCSIR